jgi:hypothetical protein
MSCLVAPVAVPRHIPSLLFGDVERLRRFDRGRVPSVAEAEHSGVRRHDVDDEIVTSPPAEWRAGRGVLDESQRAQPFRESGVLRVGRHVDDRVRILRRANAARGWVGDEEPRRTSADEDQLVQQGATSCHRRCEGCPKTVYIFRTVPWPSLRHLSERQHASHEAAITKESIGRPPAISACSWCVSRGHQCRSSRSCRQT